MLWRMLGKDQYIRELWEYYSCERSKVKRFREDAEKEKHVLEKDSSVDPISLAK